MTTKIIAPRIKAIPIPANKPGAEESLFVNKHLKIQAPILI
jgi:hypothetical protein